MPFRFFISPSGKIQWRCYQTYRKTSGAVIRLIDTILRIDHGAAFPGSDAGVVLSEMEGLLRESSNLMKDGAMSGREGFGWFDLPDTSPEGIYEAVSWLSGFDSVVQIGIGGSALGNIMLSRALCHPYYNELTRKERKGPRFYVADNADPEGASAILDMIDPSRTAYIVASKSGATSETMGNFLFFLDQAGRSGSVDPRNNFLVVTDPMEGVLRAFAMETGCRCMSVPPTVGGRFSVLSPVGLLSAGAQGIDLVSLLLGASAMKERLVRSGNIYRNPAWIFSAAAIWNYEQGRNMLTLMPYTDRLESFSEWFCQLWGESLGKNSWGSTPIRALGAIDQHSQVQLYTQGPDDKLFMLLTPTSRKDLIIPEPEEKSLKNLDYLAGKGMGSMLDLEAISTAAALIKAERPVIWGEVPVIDEFTVGALVFFFEYATALTGIAKGLDPFDQPGVEQGKRYTYGLMQRPGFDRDAAQAHEHFSKARSNTASI